MSKRKVPVYSLHKPTGQARVRLNGRDVYLGRYGTKASRDEYRKHINEWLSSQRLANLAEGELTIVELIVRYVRYAIEYYGESGEAHLIKLSLRSLRELYGTLLVDKFSPLKLKAVRETLIEAGLTRTGVNKRIDRIRRTFRWGVENELVLPTTYEALRAVRGLSPGRSKAPEAPPVEPVDDRDIDAIKPHISPQVWAMVQLQRFSGMRPGEVVVLRLVDIDRSQSVWIYRPPRHKNQWRGHERQIFLGPKCQLVLRRYLDNAKPEKYLFSPADAVEHHLQHRETKRVTPKSCGNRRGTNRRRNPKRKPGERYDVSSYRRAIHYGCQKAKIASWSPNQIRHSVATHLRREFGIEGAQIALGHRNIRMTEHYAEINREQGIEIAKQIG